MQRAITVVLNSSVWQTLQIPFKDFTQCQISSRPSTLMVKLFRGLIARLNNTVSEFFEA